MDERLRDIVGELIWKAWVAGARFQLERTDPPKMDYQVRRQYLKWYSEQMKEEINVS